MSAKPPQDDIDAIPLDVFGAEPSSAASVPSAASPAPAAEPHAAATPVAAPEASGSQTQANVRTWVEAGFEPGVDVSTGLPRRLRRLYDGLAILVLWVFAGWVYGGITLHGRMFWLLFLAAGLYVFLMRLNKGALHQRFHLFLDSLRKRVEE
jgi:hypothetical protein